jgi:cellulose synthase/poly-beta-1,6-N-acetylglucosamine synthase-like glycosyltransferase
MKVPYRVVFIADPVCWTEVPSTLAVLGRQRRRWQRGLLEALRLHRTMLFNPRYGLLGWLSYPFFLFFEGWGPLVECLGLASVLISWRLGWTDTAFAVAFLTFSVLLGMVLSLCAVLLEEFSFHRYPRWSDLARMAAYALFENVGYRQMNTLFRVHGLGPPVSARAGARCGASGSGRRPRACCSPSRPSPVPPRTAARPWPGGAARTRFPS